MKHAGPAFAGIFLMLGSDFAFAVMASSAKWTGQALSSEQIVFFRSSTSMLLLASYLLTKKVSLRGNEPRILIARGTIGYLALQCYFWALPQIPLGTGVMLNYTAPLFAVLLSYAWAHERPSKKALLSTIISFAGVCLLTSPVLSTKHLPLAAGLLSGLLAGSVHLLIRKGNRTENPLLIIFYFTAVSSLGSGLLVLQTGFQYPSSDQWLGLIVITVSSFIGQVCLTYSLQKAPVPIVSPFGYLTPVLAYVFGWALWGEPITWQSTAGTFLIVFSGVMLILHYYSQRSH